MVGWESVPSEPASVRWSKPADSWELVQVELGVGVEEEERLFRSYVEQTEVLGVEESRMAWWLDSVPASAQPWLNLVRACRAEGEEVVEEEVGH